jgi:hypothetical protein
MERVRLSLLLLAAVLLLTALPAAAHDRLDGLEQSEASPDPTSRIAGSVTDAQSGAPVAAARVQLAAAAVPPVTTDAAGRFVLEDIPTAEPSRAVTITVHADGYGTWTMRDALLYPGTTRRLSVHLDHAPTTIDAAPPQPARAAAPLPPDAMVPPAVLLAASHDQIPETIRVARTGYKLCNEWLDAGRPVQYVEEIAFRDYVKHVLPNEWIASWEPAALQAGAMAVKHFAWYKIITQVRHAETGADVLDNTCDQYYAPDTNYDTTDAAVDATWNYIMHREGRVFPVFYRNTRERCEVTGADPCMPQWGTQEDAQAGDTWQQIVQRYYAPDVIFQNGGPDPDPGTPPYSYAYVDQSPVGGDAPLWMNATLMLELRLRNTGSATWYRERSSGCTIALGTGERDSSDEPLRVRDHVSPFYVPGAAGWHTDPALAGRRVQMSEAQVAPGEVATFRFEAALPDMLGQARAYWSPVVEGPGCDAPQWLAETGMHFWLYVFPYRYEVVSRIPAQTIVQTTTATFELVLRNNGPATWYRRADTPGNTRGYAVHLATGQPGAAADNPYAQPDHASPFYVPGGLGWWEDTDDRNRIVMVEDVVPPGEVATFRFDAAVPPLVGRVEARFTPVVEHLGWMQHQDRSSLIIFSDPDGTARFVFLPTLHR